MERAPWSLWASHGHTDFLGEAFEVFLQRRLRTLLLVGWVAGGGIWAVRAAIGAETLVCDRGR